MKTHNFLIIFSFFVASMQAAILHEPKLRIQNNSGYKLQLDYKIKGEKFQKVLEANQYLDLNLNLLDELNYSTYGQYLKYTGGEHKVNLTGIKSEAAKKNTDAVITIGLSAMQTYEAFIAYTNVTEEGDLKDQLYKSVNPFQLFKKAYSAYEFKKDVYPRYIFELPQGANKISIDDAHKTLSKKFDPAQFDPKGSKLYKDVKPYATAQAINHLIDEAASQWLSDLQKGFQERPLSKVTIDEVLNLEKEWIQKLQK